MKRKLVMLLTIVAVLAVGIGIWYNVPINLMDLEHDEVIEIVVFNGNTGNATHITDETQIEHIIENLNGAVFSTFSTALSTLSCPL